MSLLRLKQNRTDEALQLIKKAKEIAPDYPEVYLQYGLVLESDNLPGEAMKMYSEGLKKIPADSESPEAEHDRKQLENAIKILKEKLEKSTRKN
jgi:tetratricopeptide (TPR) repeat protein